jgi:hypothetical protein
MQSCSEKRRCKSECQNFFFFGVSAAIFLSVVVHVYKGVFVFSVCVYSAEVI